MMQDRGETSEIEKSEENYLSASLLATRGT